MDQYEFNLFSNQVTTAVGNISAYHSDNTADEWYFNLNSFFSLENIECLIDYFFCRKIPDGRYVDVQKPLTFSSFRPFEETVFIVHGFNGTARDKHMRYLKDGNWFYFFHIAVRFLFHFLYCLYVSFELLPRRGKAL